MSWRLSPSSSGYKTQSQRSESITPSPTSTPHYPGERQDSTATNASDISTSQMDEPQLVWAVTNIHNVPKGSIIIDPKVSLIKNSANETVTSVCIFQTLEPIKNHDGTLYHYDPSNPPLVLNKPPLSPQKQTTSPVKQSISPKRRSPAKKSVVTSTTATSPSLPYPSPPPLQHSRSFPPPPEQQYVYGSENSAVVYQQQPCIVYTTPYGLPPLPYENRMEAPVQEVPNYYMGEPPMTYQQPGWTPQYYQTAAPSRYNIPPQQSSPYIPSYQPNYMPSPATGEVIPLYQQVVYPTPPPQPQPVYQSQPVVYAQNATYPQCTNTYCGQMVEPFTHLAHSMSQLSLGCNNGRMQKNATPKGNKFSNPKGVGSSQSSTGTSSPAMTVVAGQGIGMYRTPPPETPTTPGFMHPMFMRQVTFSTVNAFQLS